MANQQAEAPQLLDGMMALSRQARQRALLSEARGEGLWLSDVSLGLVVILSVSAAFLDPPHAGISALLACLSISAVLASRIARQTKAICALLEMGRSE